jgi:rfaE bifunctional protein nucleotidyltransferase chain/domain
LDQWQKEKTRPPVKVVERKNIRKAVNPIAKKLFDFRAACRQREELRRTGTTVVLTNGCFDLLHGGHVFSLENAKKFGDSLWVALNSDRSVRTLKGSGRPIFNELERAYLLSALAVVDGIFVFDGARLDGEILAFRPDSYVKAGDYTLEKLDPAEREALISVGATIHFAPFLEGVGTTSILAKIRNGS